MERVDHAVPVVLAAIQFLRESVWKQQVKLEDSSVFPLDLSQLKFYALPLFRSVGYGRLLLHARTLIKLGLGEEFLSDHIAYSNHTIDGLSHIVKLDFSYGSRYSRYALPQRFPVAVMPRLTLMYNDIFRCWGQFRCGVG